MMPIDPRVYKGVSSVVVVDAALPKQIARLETKALIFFHHTPPVHVYPSLLLSSSSRQGLAIKSLYTEQGIQHIAQIQHFTQDPRNMTGQLLILNMQEMKLSWIIPMPNWVTWSRNPTLNGPGAL
jgi:hypothetical protein